MNKLPGLADFSNIIHNPAESEIRKAFRPDYHKLGFVIFYYLKDILPKKFPFLRIWQYVIMPDHIHFIIQIKEKILLPLDAYIWQMRVDMTQTARKRNFIPADVKDIFEWGFNDQFLKTGRSLDRLFHYIAKNPYWYWQRKKHPEFFKNIQEMMVCGVKCSLYGNLGLLDNPFKYPVISHRADRLSGAIKRKMEEWDYAISNGGVLVSPFIHDDEKTFMRKAFENDGKVILISDTHFGPREKPYEALLEQCNKGNLLIISPDMEGALGLNYPFRQGCLYRNALAEKISDSLPLSALKS